MSNRRRSLKDRIIRKRERKTCPKCKSQMYSQHFADAVLWVCTNPKCRFPIREVKHR
jgi:ribosomal protein L37AE/L43A